jgi:hypothetical protein
MKLSTFPDVIKTAISEEIIGCFNYRINSEMLISLSMSVKTEAQSPNIGCYRSLGSILP